MTRAEEKYQIAEYIKQHGVTVLPPDVRGPETIISPWIRPKRGRKKKPQKVLDKTLKI